ncbi:MAG: hypothetical protein WBP40_02830 [Candidatus Moraniibacteriota bacterium]
MHQKPLFLATALIALLVIAGAFWYLQYRPTAMNQPIGITDPIVEPVTQTEPRNPIDTSDWKMYRNEEYGFGFQLSDEYVIPENSQNIIGEKEGTHLLDPRKSEYLFSSRKGLEKERILAGMGDAMDGWRIQVRIYPYAKLIESNFEKWVKQNGKASFDKVGKSTLRNGSDVGYVSWDSFCNDYSAFFIRKSYILEFNSCASNYFSHTAGGEEDYFSSILNSVQF